MLAGFEVTEAGLPPQTSGQPCSWKPVCSRALSDDSACLLASEPPIRIVRGGVLLRRVGHAPWRLAALPGGLVASSATRDDKKSPVSKTGDSSRRCQGRPSPSARLSGALACWCARSRRRLCDSLACWQAPWCLAALTGGLVASSATRDDKKLPVSKTGNRIGA